LHSKVTNYVDFKVVDGSYVVKGADRVQKVPATEVDAVKTPLVGFFQKRRLRTFLVFVANFKEDDRSTHEGINVFKTPMRAVFEHFSLDDNTQEFLGHAMALHSDDGYLDRPAIDTILPLQLYAYSLDRYGKSPYLYPLYGLGCLPEGFSRLCAIHGGTFMLNTTVDEILYDENGQAKGVRHGGEVATGNFIIGDPSYFGPDKVKKTGRVIRSICIMNHPIPNTDDSESCQIIMPQNQIGRSHDIYISAVSFAHRVAARGAYVAIVSTKVETDDPLAEIAPALALLGPVMERFDNICDTYEPRGDGMADRCFISTSYDATSHFESCAQDVLKLYQAVTGEELDMNINADNVQD
jgi:Rab GDP dissociation inhibitor